MRRPLVAALAAAALAAGAAPTTAAPTGYPARPLQGEDLRPTFEASIAVHPRDPRQVAVAAIRVEPSYVERYTTEAPQPVDHVWVSSDGGRSFRESGPLPGLDPRQPSSNDPTLAWSRDGTLWASYTAFSPGSDPGAGQAGLYAAASRDGGRTWRRSTRIEGFDCAGPDRSTIAVDPVRHWVYVAWVHYTELECSGTIDSARTVVRWSRSVDGGRTWSAPVDASGPGDTAQVTPAVLPDGTLLVVTLTHFGPLIPRTSCAGTAAQVHVRRYDVRGRMVGEVDAIPELCEAQGLSPNGYAAAVIRHPAAAVDPVSGRALVAAPYLSATRSGVAVAASDDGGRTWRQTVVAGGPGTTASMAALGTGPRGRVALVHLEVQPGGLYYPVLATSADGGTTFGAPQRLVDVASVGNARARTPFDPYNIGHYLGVAVGPDGVAHAVWPDVRPRAESPADVALWVRGVRLP